MNEKVIRLRSSTLTVGNLAYTDPSSLTILPRDSRFTGQSHEQLGKSHGKRIDKLIHPDADFSEAGFLVR